MSVALGSLTAEATANKSDWEAQVKASEVGKPDSQSHHAVELRRRSNKSESPQQGWESCQRKEDPWGIMHHGAGWEVRIHTSVMAIECVNNVLGHGPILSPRTFGK